MHMLRGFRKELTKTAELDPKGGLQGAALGALVGAVLGGVSPHILAKMLTRNSDLMALFGSLVGAGGGAVVGSLVGKKVEQQKSAASMQGAAEVTKIPGTGAKLFATPKANPVLGTKSGVEHASARRFITAAKKLKV